MDDLATSADRYLEAGGLRLDLRNKQLHLHGRVVDLRPRSWSLLKCLAEHPGQLLTKDEIMQMVWGETVVTEASLNQAIRDLRKILGDDARSGWASSLAAFPNQQAKEADSRGMPGTEVMKAYLQAVSDAGYQWPYEYKID